MKVHPWRLVVIVAASILVAAVWVVLNSTSQPSVGIPSNPDILTVFSIAGHTGLPKSDPLPTTDLFHGYPVLGRVEVREPAERGDILTDVDNDIVTGAIRARCFLPRHGLRIVGGGRTIDLIVCYECSTAMIHEGEEHRTVSIASSSKPKLNEILTSAGVPLAPEPGTR